jgi:hypothetical protein
MNQCPIISRHVYIVDELYMNPTLLTVKLTIFVRSYVREMSLP